jgi:hypothetical protein
MRTSQSHSSRGHSWRIARIASITVGTLTLVGGTLAMTALPAGAAQTHENCITFDDNTGEIVSVTPSCSETITVKNLPPESQPDANPCTGDPGTFTLTDARSVFHVNVNRDGEIWVSGTDEGTAAFISDDSSGVSGTGHWADWFGFNLNEQNMESTSTFNISIHLSDGQNVTSHDVSHDLLTPNGVEISFDKPTQSSCS